MIFIVLQYILIFDKKIFQINVNIYNLSISVFFIISLPFFVNSVHKAPNIVRNPFNDVGKNGIPRPILTPCSTLAMVSISVLSNLLSFSNCSSDIIP